MNGKRAGLLMNVLALSSSLLNENILFLCSFAFRELDGNGVYCTYGTGQFMPYNPHYPPPGPGYFPPGGPAGPPIQMQPQG